MIVGILLISRWAFAGDEVDVIVDGDQRPDAAFGAAGDDVAGVEHALGGGDGDIAQQSIAGAVDGQEIGGSRHRGILEGDWESGFNVSSEAT